MNATEFADHIATARSSFGPAADGLFFWVRFLDYSGSGPDALNETWIPTEVLWLSQTDPLPCLELRFNAWRDAIREIGAVAIGMLPFGGTSEDEFTRFAEARDAIESFEPLEGVTANC